MITFSPVAVLSRVNAPPEPVSETVNTNCPLGSLAIMSFSPGTVAAPPPSSVAASPRCITLVAVTSGDQRIDVAEHDCGVSSKGVKPSRLRRDVGPPDWATATPPVIASAATITAAARATRRVLLDMVHPLVTGRDAAERTHRT